ncbi:MAG: hypothetical protein IPK83_20955 [Planctomycetes bacterium]|nr:hypothetical protein [Planctomycetota bacterium]
MQIQMAKVLILVFCQSTDQSVPEVLSKAITDRMNFKTADLRYSISTKAYNAGAMIKTRYHVRFSDEDIYFHNMGDDDGVLMHDPRTGIAILGVAHACSSNYTVRSQKTGEEWFTRDGQPTLFVGYIENSPNEFDDPRSIGSGVNGLRHTSPAKWLEELQRHAGKWTVKHDDDEIVVRLESKPLSEGAPHSEVIWKIDPAKNNAITEVSDYKVMPDGKRDLLHQRVNGYARHKNRWWLEKSELRGEGGVLVEVTQFDHAEFDMPKHPKYFDADMLGLPPGVKTMDYRLLRDGQHQGKLYASRHLGGGMVVTQDEWKSTYSEQYDLNSLREYEQSVRRQFGIGQYPKWWGISDPPFGLVDAAYTPDLWEAYVRRWIVVHSHDVLVGQKQQANGSLTEAQVESAWAVLKDCRKRADPILARLAKAESQDSKIPTSNPAKTLKPSREQKELSQIFELLKGRLEKLLRSDQIISIEGKKAG